MAVTTKKQFAATTNATTTVFSPVSIQLNNQDDLDVYVTLSGGTRVLQLRQSTGSTAQASHPQVNNTDGLYFPAVSAGTTLYNYQLSSDNNTITFNSALPSGAVVFCERRTRDADSAYTSFASGSTIRATDLNNSSTESNFTGQDARNKALDLENAIFGGTQPTVNGVVQPFVDSAKIIDGSIASADIANNAIVTDKIANDAVTMAKLGSGSLPTDITVSGSNIVDLSVNTVDIADDAVTPDKLANTSVSAGTYTAADITVDAQGRLTSAATGTIATSEIEADAITGAKIADDAVDSEHIAADSLDTEHYAPTSIDSAAIASNAVITSKITDANVTTTKIADSNVTLAKLANDLKQTTISDSDTQLPTSGAVVDYVAAQLEPFGGFEAIANEISFPNTQPASGVAISIADAAGIVVSASGSSTTGRTVGGSTVTINNIPSNFHSSTVATGIRFIVTSTGSGQVYNYHKATLPESDLVSLSGDINDFNERYRVGSNNPTSNNDSGDLFFNTSTGKMLVFNGTSSAFEEVQSIGNFFISTLSPAFNGTLQNFTLSNAPTNVQQVLLVINGVVQKPNAGTSTPSEGFALDGSTIKLGAAPATGSTYHAVVMGSTVNIGTPSNNTVTSAILQDNAVATAKIADGAVTAAKLAGSISSSLLSDDSVTTAKIADGAVTAAKMGTLGSNSVGTTQLVDQNVTLDKLPHGTSSNDGKFLRANNGADPSFEDVSLFTTLTEHTGADANGNSAGDLIFAGTDTDSSGSVTDEDRTKYDKSLNTFNLGRNVRCNIGFLNISTKTAATNFNNGHVLQYSAHFNMSTGADIWFSTVGKRVLIGTSDTANHEVASFQCSALGASQHGFAKLNYVTANAGGSTSMQPRLLTTQTGMTFTGVIVPAADSTHDLGTNAVRWRNVYADTYYGDGSNLTGVSSAEVYGFNTNASGNLVVTTTNGGADNISGTDFDAFEDVIFAATGFTFSVNANGKLIATV